MVKIDIKNDKKWSNNEIKNDPNRLKMIEIDQQLTKIN
jgi:hypothetical protein